MPPCAGPIPAVHLIASRPVYVVVDTSGLTVAQTAAEILRRSPAEALVD